MVKLEQITIKKYCDLLRAGVVTEEVKEISNELNKSLESFGSGIDLALFLLQKDLLIMQCKMAIAILERDDKKTELYKVRIEKLTKEIKGKEKKVKPVHPYNSFLSWLQAVEKYFGFSIDKNNDLVYFSEATKQMLNNYENQKKQLEQSNQQRK